MQLRLLKWVFCVGFCIGVSACTTSTIKFVTIRDSVRYYNAHQPGPDRKHRVDVKPEPVGGMRALISRLHYPRDLRRKRVTGVVWVRVSIDTAGHVTSAKIAQGVHPVLDEIALKAIRETPWNPAMKNGKAIAWSFRLPIIFSYR